MHSVNLKNQVIICNLYRTEMIDNEKDRETYINLVLISNFNFH